MSQEKMFELKALCLELATENCKHCPDNVLKVASDYFAFIMDSKNYLSKQQ